MLTWNNEKGFYNWNTERLDTCADTFDLVEWIANLMAVKVTGKGYHFSTEDKQIKAALKILQEHNDISSLLYEDVRQKSVYGFSSVCVNINILEQPIILIGHPYMMTQVAQINWETEGGVMYTRYGTGGSNGFWIKTTADKYTLKNEGMIGDGKNLVTLVGDKQLTVSPQNIFMDHYQHNVGKSPLFLLQNKPKKNYWAGQIGLYYPDLTGAPGLQQRYNDIVKNMMKEVELNRTRILLGVSPQEIGALVEQLNAVAYGMSYKTFLSQGGIQSLNQKTYHSDLILTNNAGKDVDPTFMLGNPVIEKYIMGLEYIKDQAKEIAGLSPKTDSTSIKTEAEVYFTKSDEIETVVLKRTFYQTQWKKVFDVALMMMGIPKEKLDQYSFELKHNLFIDRGQEVDNQAKLIDLGGSSPVRAYMMIYGVSREEALKAMDEIKEENRKYGNLMNQTMEHFGQQYSQEKSEQNPNKNKGGE